METWEAITARRNVRQYQPEPVSDDDLNRAGRPNISTGAAAAIAFVIPEPRDERRTVTDQYDVGQATMAMMIMATDLGIGTGHSSVGDQDKARHPWRSRGLSGGLSNRCRVSGDRPLNPIYKPKPTTLR
jgi:nitroreductase